MLSINTNLSSLIAQNSMSKATDRLNLAIERMTSGAKINHAKDNAANYSISTNLTTKIGAYDVVAENVAMGMDLIATANGSLDQISDKLQRLRDLAEQASNGTYGTESLRAINTEASALVDEIDRLYSTAKYNGIKLLEHQTQNLNGTMIPKAQYNGFIKEIVKRDTSTMTAFASVESNKNLADGTYSISTPEEMKKLADMTNAGLISAGDEFVLASDVDLSQYENWVAIGNAWGAKRFLGIFDGNGYKISNLQIKEGEANGTSLFGISNGTIKNIALVDININVNKSNVQATGLISHASGIIDNCYVTGDIKTLGSASGLCVNLYGTLSNCWTEVNLLASGDVSGITTFASGNVIIENCFTKSINNSLNRSAGILVNTAIDANVTLQNCHVLSDTELTGVFVSIDPARTATINIIDCGYNSSYDKKQTPLYSETLATMNINNVVSSVPDNSEVLFMIGVNFDSNSQLVTDISLDLKNFRTLKFIGDFDFDYLRILDSILSGVFEKQTYFGVTSNRLESALDEISVQQENLISSLSTIRDADIADESSEYIRQQILQQAASTLLATANQSPSIALQLI